MHQRTTIAEEENALMRCDAELEKLRKIVENMELEKNALQTRISKRRYLVSAIHRVPVEIWDAIFRYVVVSWPRDCRDSATGYSLHVHYDHHEWDSESEESKDKGSEGEPGDVLAPPLILSQVSSHWRRLVKSLPHLWSSISVDIYGLDRDIRPLLEMYYECSGEHPLTIEIVDSQWQGFGVDCKLQDLRDKFGWDSEQAGRDVFLSLMMEMYRCRELCVDLFKGIIKGDAPDISFPVLRSFTGNGHNSELSFQWLWSAIRQAPQLVHTKTRLLHSLPMIPFRQIKSLTIESLTSCVNLETLTILFFQRDLGDENYEDSIVLASVRTCFLRVDDEEPEDMDRPYGDLVLV
ncbi:hypothetical protein MPER_09500 [Moniliophthora perniciosa FA553]|nr:hypothetical protein MPER_09500 [Moniliophthora perniciosa FA553]